MIVKIWNGKSLVANVFPSNLVATMQKLQQLRLPHSFLFGFLVDGHLYQTYTSRFSLVPQALPVLRRHLLIQVWCPEPNGKDQEAELGV